MKRKQLTKKEIKEMDSSLRMRFFQWFYKNRYHFVADVKENRAVSFYLYNHRQYLSYKASKIKETANINNPIESIENLLEDCRKNCNLVIFDCGDDRKFVRFIFSGKKIWVDWVIIDEENDLSNYLPGMLGVLEALDIPILAKSGEESKKYPYYKVMNFKEFDTHRVNFNKDAEKATEFVARILIRVFKQDITKLRVKIG